jgi:hypothetical protein
MDREVKPFAYQAGGEQQFRMSFLKASLRPVF